jgi:hypothetical protein
MLIRLIEDPNNPSAVSLYFNEVVRGVFDEYFAARGARLVASRRDKVRYESQKWFAQAIYLPEDGPRYCPRVEIGVLKELFVDPRRNELDVFHTVPEDNDLRRYIFEWRYTNRGQAEEAFVRVRDEIMTVFADAFLNDVSRLHILLEKFAEELDRQWRDEFRSHHDSISRIAANAAFRAGDYETAARHFAEIPTDSLTPSERKKLEIARKRR